MPSSPRTYDRLEPLPPRDVAELVRATTLREAEEWLGKESFAAVVLDIGMPHLNGLDAGSQVKQKLPGVKLVFLTMTMEADVAAEAFRRGASAYVLKQSAGDELVLAIRKVNQGASYLSPLIAKETVMYLLNQGENFSEAKHITKRQS